MKPEIQPHRVSVSSILCILSLVGIFFVSSCGVLSVLCPLQGRLRIGERCVIGANLDAGKCYAEYLSFHTAQDARAFSLSNLAFGSKLWFQRQYTFRASWDTIKGPWHMFSEPPPEYYMIMDDFFWADCSFPLWATIIVFCVYPGVVMYRGPFARYKRQRDGQCLSCSYGLTGNVSGICPECGTPIKPSELREDLIMMKRVLLYVVAPLIIMGCAYFVVERTRTTRSDSGSHIAKDRNVDTIMDMQAEEHKEKHVEVEQSNRKPSSSVLDLLEAEIAREENEVMEGSGNEEPER